MSYSDAIAADISADALQDEELLSCSVFLFATLEMSIIEEFERNQQFEQQYISSVVEGMDEMHIICPICHM